MELNVLQSWAIKGSIQKGTRECHTALWHKRLAICASWCATRFRSVLTWLKTTVGHLAAASRDSLIIWRLILPADLPASLNSWSPRGNQIQEWLVDDTTRLPAWAPRGTPLLQFLARRMRGPPISMTTKELCPCNLWWSHQASFSTVHRASSIDIKGLKKISPRHIGCLTHARSIKSRRKKTNYTDCDKFTRRINLWFGNVVLQ
jgi:hypothetical protein